MIRILLALVIGAFAGALYPAIMEDHAAQDAAELEAEYQRGLTDGAREASLNALHRRCTWQQWLAVDK